LLLPGLRHAADVGSDFEETAKCRHGWVDPGG
jgi:hypothetical protein